MSDKILINKKDINSAIKAIEVHLNILENIKIYIENESDKEKLLESMRYLKKIPDMLRPLEKEYAQLKRDTYTKYVNEKRKLQEMKKDKGSDAEIKIQAEKVNKLLQLYLKLKEAQTTK